MYNFLNYKTTIKIPVANTDNKTATYTNKNNKKFTAISHNQPLHIPPHWHHEIELLYFYNPNSSGTIHCGHENIDIKPNLFVVCNPSEIHSIFLDRHTNYICIQLKPDFYENMTIAKKKYQHAIYNDEKIASLVKCINDEYNKKNSGFNIVILARLCELFSHLQANYVYSKSAQNNPIEKLSKIYGTLQYLDEHYAELLSASFLASRCYLSKDYFCHLFKKETGLSYIEYINRLRIEKSKELLYTSNLSITEIATRIGFDNSSYFCRVFKKYTGLSPTEARNSRMTVRTNQQGDDYLC